MISALALGVALGAAQAQDFTEAKQDGSMIVTYKDDVSTLDPAIGCAWQNGSVIKSLFDGLMDYEPGTTIPNKDLAEDYTICTYKLREGVKFHNGRELIAEDVKSSLDRGTNPETQSPGAGFSAPLTDMPRWPLPRPRAFRA